MLLSRNYLRHWAQANPSVPCSDRRGQWAQRNEWMDNHTWIQSIVILPIHVEYFLLPKPTVTAVRIKLTVKLTTPRTILLPFGLYTSRFCACVVNAAGRKIIGFFFLFNSLWSKRFAGLKNCTGTFLYLSSFSCIPCQHFTDAKTPFLHRFATLRMTEIMVFRPNETFGFSCQSVHKNTHWDCFSFSCSVGWRVVIFSTCLEHRLITTSNWVEVWSDRLHLADPFSSPLQSDVVMLTSPH